MELLVNKEIEYVKTLNGSIRKRLLSILNAKPTDLKLIETDTITEIPQRYYGDILTDKNVPVFSFKKFYLNYKLYDTRGNEYKRMVYVDIPTLNKKNFKQVVINIIGQEIDRILHQLEDNTDYSPLYIQLEKGVTITIETPKAVQPYTNLILNKYTKSYGNEIIPVEEDCVIHALSKLWKIPFDKFPTGGITIPESIELAKKMKRSVKFLDRFNNEILSYKHSNKHNYANLIVVDHQHIEINPTFHKFTSYIYYKQTEFYSYLNSLLITTIPFITSFNNKTKKPTSFIYKDIKHVLDIFDRVDIPEDKTTLSYYFDKVILNTPPFYSVYNKQVAQLIAARSFNPIIKNYKKSENCFVIDLNSCYTNVLRGNFKHLPKKFKIPIFDICDQITDFEEGDIIQPGYYFIKSIKKWVFHVTVIEKNYIPTKKIYASDFIYNTDIFFDIQDKLVRNSILGNFQKQSKIYNDTQLFTTQEEALRFSDKIGRYEDFYTSSKISISDDVKNYRPVIGCIIELYHILIEKMENEFKMLGIIVSEIRTDSFLIDKLPEPSFYKEWNCKLESNKSTIFISAPIIHREVKIIQDTWNIYKESDIEMLISTGQSFLCLGPAGSGKSTIIRKIKGSKIAFTHTAAENIGGNTINSTINYTEYDQTIVIDEVTQVPLDLFIKFYGEKFSTKQLIGFGDSNQLSPIMPNAYTLRHNHRNIKKKDMIYREFNIKNQQFAIELFQNLVILETIHRTKEDIKLIPVETLSKSDNYKAILCFSKDECKKFNDIKFAQFNNKFGLGVQVANIHTRRRYIITKKRKGFTLTPINKNHEVVTVDHLKDYIVSFAKTIYSCQGEEYDNYLVINYEKITGKNKYVVDTRRTTANVHYFVENTCKNDN